MFPLRVRSRSIRFPLWFFVLAVAAAAPTARAQSSTDLASAERSPVRGHEVEVWSGFGGDPIGTPHVTLGNRVWTTGFRYGWILTEAHGPGFLRGTFEYAVDALPVVMVFQPGGRAYGFGFDPWIMKWNLEPRHRISPYVEIGGGVLIATRDIPLGEGSHFNFTPTGALGVNILRGKYHWSIDFRYFHISDAQITPFNPGTDTFGVRVGWGTYSH